MEKESGKNSLLGFGRFLLSSRKNFAAETSDSDEFRNLADA
jgi:hypothetical protein